MLSLVLALSLGNVVTLDATTESLEVATSSTSSTDYVVSYVDNASGALTPGSAHGNITTATTTTVLAAPAASTQRAVTAVSVCNVGAAAQALTVKHDTSGTERTLARASIGAGECLRADNNGAWTVATVTGLVRTVDSTAGFGGKTLYLAKIGTASDAAGYWTSYLGLAGTPGAWVPGTPGLNGAVTDCSTAAGASTMGAPMLPTPSSGWYVTRFGVTAAVVDTYRLIDTLWYNTGLVVTTTTAQAITSPTWPARDENGGTTGEGLSVALYFTTAATNAATISNSTISYTNTQGTAGRTASLRAVVGFMIPATPVVHTWVEFGLQAGDTGIQSIQSVTLGTSLVTGSVSLVVYRHVQSEGVSLANGPSGSLVVRPVPQPGVRLYSGACLSLVRVGSTATTAAGIYGGVVEVMDQ